MILEFTDIFLSTLDIEEFLLGPATSNATLKSNGCRPDLSVGNLSVVHAAIGLDFGKRIETASCTTTVLSLEGNGASSGAVVLDANNLHAELVGEQLACLSFTKFPPPGTSNASTIPPFNFNVNGRLSHHKVSLPLLHALHPALNHWRFDEMHGDFSQEIQSRQCIAYFLQNDEYKTHPWLFELQQR